MINAIINYKLNMALTRARMSTFVCGDLQKLNKDEVWKDFLEYASVRQLIRKVTSYDATNLLSMLVFKEL